MYACMYICMEVNISTESSKKPTDALLASINDVRVD